MANMRSLLSNSGPKECSEDGQTLREHEIFRDRSCERQILQQLCLCSSKERGFKWSGPFELLEVHTFVHSSNIVVLSWFSMRCVRILRHGMRQQRILAVTTNATTNTTTKTRFVILACCCLRHRPKLEVVERLVLIVISQMPRHSFRIVWEVVELHFTRT